MGTLVTVATDGFRDYVSLPDGRTFNLGSVSVLKLITTLVPSGAMCRQALNVFLRDKHATISADLAALEKLLQPKRSRWAGHENRLIPPDPRNLPRGASTMNPDQAQAQAIQNQIAAIETHIALLEQTAKEHAAGSQSKQQVDNSIETLKQLVADLAKSPSGQSVNEAFYVKLGSIETAVAGFDATGAANQDAIRSLHFLTTSMARLGSETIKQGAIDQDQKNELKLYMDDESRLDRQKQSILQNILRKMKAGRYDPSSSWKLWTYWVDEGVKMYAKQFGGDMKTQFPEQLREVIAKEYAVEEKKKIEDGEYSNLKVAVEAEAPTTMPPEVQKAEDVAQGKVEDPYKGKDLSDNAMAYKLGADPTKQEWETALKTDEKMLTKIRAHIKTLEGGGQVENLTLPNAKQVEQDLEQVIESKKRLLSKLAAGAGVVEGTPEEVAKQMGVDDPYAGKDLSKNDTFYKLADQEIEALATSLMTKVEGALQVVESSPKANTHLAKKDLHIISSKLATVLQGSDLSDPTTRPNLLGLASMADKIQAHFAS